MGFLPSYTGLNFNRRIGELNLGGCAFFWVTINDSKINDTDTAIDVRQFYGTVAGDWGGMLVGKDFGLFSRSNIFLDELLVGFDNPNGALGLVDSKDVSFGNIDTGYPYPFPTSQVTYRNSDLPPGLYVAMGILDPIDSNQIDKDASDGLGSKAYQDDPHYESEVSYQFDLTGAQVYSWINNGYQTSKNTDDSIDNVTSKGVGCGLQVKMGGFSVTGSRFAAKGINPFFTNNVGEAALHKVDSRDTLLQGPYSWGRNRLALSYSETVDDGNGLSSATDYESHSIAHFRTINDNLRLVTELNRYRIGGHDDATLDEDTDTVALSAVLNW